MKWFHQQQEIFPNYLKQSAHKYLLILTIFTISSPKLFKQIKHIFLKKNLEIILTLELIHITTYLFCPHKILLWTTSDPLKTLI